MERAAMALLEGVRVAVMTKVMIMTAKRRARKKAMRKMISCAQSQSPSLSGIC
jgi:hypothetical protein